MKRLISFVSIVITLFTVVFSPYQTAYATGLCYVNDNAGGTNTGTSWANAYTSLQSAIADSCAEIWVAAGTYKPTFGTDQFISFIIKNGVSIYGGFSGTETIRDQRNSDINVTTLSGDIGIIGDSLDNSLNVITGNNIDNSTILDGFIISSGNAHLSTHNSGGGGGINLINSSPKITNVIIRDNYGINGGGMYLNNSSPILTNVTFEKNTAYIAGAMYSEISSNPSLNFVVFDTNFSYSDKGAMANINSTSELNYVIFINNGSNGWSGGIYNDNSDLILDNVIFNNNSGGAGGAISNNNYSTLFIDHSIFESNKSTDGGAIYNGTSYLNVKNSTFYQNEAKYPYNPDGNGGVLYNAYGEAILTNITAVGNSANTFSAIANWGNNSATVTIHNSIIWGNTGLASQIGNFLSSRTSVDHSIVQGGYSGIGNLYSPPQVDALANNGGFTKTIALLPDSPAIDAGDDTMCPNSDQRGITRPQRIHCDIGAFEYIVHVSSVVRASASPTSTSSVEFNVTFSEDVQNVDADDFDLTTTGVSSASITGVTPVSASVYTVTVSTGSGNGTIRLDLPNTASIKDLSNNNLSGLPYTSGEVYIINKNVSLPVGWIGSVSVTSDKNLVAVGRPHIGAEIASYDGFSSGALSSFVPMLFKDAFGGSYDAALYIQNVSNSNSANITLEYFDNTGTLNCTKADTISPLASKGYWLPSVTCDSGSLPAGWVGGVKVTSDQPIVAVGRPHIGSEVMTYNGFSSGSTSAFIPMLFKGAFGGSYNAAFYIQNVSGSSANLTLEYFDSTGTLNCTKSDTLSSLASKGYWLPSTTCDSGSLPAGWVGGVRVTSDQPIVSVGRPHIGSQITTYDGFSAGTGTSYVPMLFKDAFGGSYDAAFYLQNVHAANTANVTIKYYDNAGTLNCTKTDTLAPLASKGYWVPSATCDSGSLPVGWVGGVEVTSDQPIVAVGRPHIGAQVTTYNGFTSGAASAFLPMLFKDAFGGSYDAAFYLQNTEASAASVTIQFYDSTGALTCSRTDTIQPRATLGFWVPSLTCMP